MTRKLIALFFIAQTSVSCNSFLDLEPVGNRTEADFFSSEADLTDAIVGVYAAYQTSAFARDELFWDNQSDDHWRAGDHSDDEDIETFNTNTYNAKVANTYQGKYDIIAKATGVLLGAPKVAAQSSISEDTYNTIVGEAYFLRAFAYYRLMILHGEVQLINEDEVTAGNYNVPKSSYTEVSDFIIQDLEQAANLLPLRNEPSRVNKGAAWALLNMVYMDRAREYADEEMLGKAISSGRQVIDNYALAEDYHALFLPGNEGVEEVLFVLMNDVPWMGDLNRMPAHRGPRPWGAYGFQEPLDDLVDEFEAGDERKSATVISDGESIWRNDLGWVEHTPGLSSTGNSYTKYMHFNQNGSYNRTLNVPLLRAAYTYLMVAEAQIRLDGPGAGDALINEVRKRADLVPIAGAGINDLMHETRVEMAGENMRHQHLLRWDKAGIIDLEEYYARPEKMHPSDVGRRVFRRPKNYYQPLPLLAIDNSNGVLVQNPLWIGE
ncbi:RagB/SusD family nutrient uptake outer membrane protein [Parapedobacter sp. GCM10030251]|uniref:RagB/SusD family nutrient uptake outer membrane protein n=1 Tax=Parapedobacter sp. GCM10030251 TaxID=3273419 RepID=UPI00361542B8